MTIQKNKEYTAREIFIKKLIPASKKEGKNRGHQDIIKLFNNPDPVKGLHGLKIRKTNRFFYVVEGQEIIRYIKDNYPQIKIKVI